MLFSIKHTGKNPFFAILFFCRKILGDFQRKLIVKACVCVYIIIYMSLFRDLENQLNKNTEYQ